MSVGDLSLTFYSRHDSLGVNRTVYPISGLTGYVHICLFHISNNITNLYLVYRGILFDE